MAPWLRRLHAVGLLLVLTVTTPAHASHAAEPAPAESRAGSRAGEGRQRPGREAAPQDEGAAVLRPEIDPGVPDAPEGPASPESTVSPEIGSEIGPEIGPEPSQNVTQSSSPSVEQAVARPVRTMEPGLRILPLGSGLVLIGLGLGLAFLALRGRRG